MKIIHKLIEFLYVAFLLIVLIRLSFIFAPLQVVCMVPLLAGIFLFIPGFSYLLGESLVAVINPYDKSGQKILSNVINVIPLQFEKFRKDKTNRTNRRFYWYFIFGLILFCIGIILTLLFNYLKII